LRLTNEEQRTRPKGGEGETAKREIDEDAENIRREKKTVGSILNGEGPRRSMVKEKARDGVEGSRLGGIWRGPGPPV